MEIYISYSWKMPVRSIVRQWLCPILKKNDIHYNIDLEDCEFGDNIEEFENQIGEAENVLVVLSKSYFYSFNCMYELALMMKNNWYGKHLIWVSLDDFERKDVESESIYKHWKAQKKELKEKIDEDADMGRLFQKDLEKVQLILDYFPDAWEIIKWTNTLSFEEVAVNDFQKLVARIKNELKIEDINPDVPMEVGDAPKGISVAQYGDKNVVQTIIGGQGTINM